MAEAREGAGRGGGSRLSGRGRCGPGRRVPGGRVSLRAAQVRALRRRAGLDDVPAGARLRALRTGARPGAVRARTRPRPGAVRARARTRPRRDRGTASIEFLGFLPVLLLVGLAAVQLGLAAYAAQQAGSAARAAARTATLDDPRVSPGDAGRAALSGWLRTEGAPEAPACDGGGRTTATVTVAIPSVLPFLGDRTVTRRATMACPAALDAPPYPDPYPNPYPNPRSAP